jgi:hypothetical protein
VTNPFFDHSIRGERLERRITAYHEAAHAVLAFKFGIAVDEVAICRAGPVAGYVRYFRASLMSAVEASESECTTELEWAILVRDTEQRAMVLLAGALAEAKLLGTPMRSHCCESDLRRCMELCDALSSYRQHLVETTALKLPKIDAADLAQRLRRRAQRMLARPDTWSTVSALAADVEGWGLLTGHDSADTVQWARAARSQLALRLPMPRSSVAKHPSGQRNREASRPTRRRRAPRQPSCHSLIAGIVFSADGAMFRS